MNDTRIAGINWRRGAVRLWVLASVLWCAGVFSVGLINTNATWLPSDFSAMVHVRISDTETRDYPAEWGVERIRDDVEKRLGEEQRKEYAAHIPAARQAECRALENKSKNDLKDLPADCGAFHWSELLASLPVIVPSGWEPQVETAPVSAWRVTAPAMPLAVGPPLVVLALGVALFWVFAGFRRDSP